MAALLMLTGLTSGCVSTVTGSPTPVAARPTVTAETLPALLLPAADVGSAVSGKGMLVTRDVTGLWDDSARMKEAAADVGCLAVAGAAQRGVYAGSGWTAVHGQVLRDPPTGPTWSHFATQAVVLFNSAQSASDFFSHSSDVWSSCSRRDLTYPQQLAPEQKWSVGQVALEGDVLTVSREQHSPQQWSCQRALTVHGRVAVDVEACSLDGPTTAASSMARAIADRIRPA